MNDLPRPTPKTIFVCLALVLMGLAGSLYKIHFPPGPVADEAAYLMIAQSLWHDHDLNYDGRDLARAYDVWDQGPFGLILFTDDGGKTMYYGKPYVYSLAAMPFYVAFGPQGMIVFNMALYLAMFYAAWLTFRRAAGNLGLLLAGFFFAAASFLYVFWMQPEVFNMALVFFTLLIWHHVRQREVWGRRELLLLVVAGGLLAAAYVSREPLAVFAVPVVVDLVWQRRWKGLVALILPAALAGGLLIGVQWKLTDHWSPYRGVQRRSFENEYPLQAETDLWSRYKGTTFGSWSGLRIETNPRVLARDLEYFLVGRHVGLVPYYPFALYLLALYLMGPRDRSRHLLLLAVAAYCGVLFLLRPHNFHGGAGFVGNRYFASIYPALLFLPGRLRGRWSLALPYAAVGLWTAAVMAVPLQQVAPEFGLQVHTRVPSFQALPLELTLVPEGRLPGIALRNWAQGLWIVPRQNFFAHEDHPNGVWVRGASRSEVIVVSPAPIEHLHFTVFSPLPANVVSIETDSGVRRVLTFTTDEERRGQAVDLPVEPIARNLGFFGDHPREYFYRFVLETRSGWLPARTNPKSHDFRYLSAFLSFNGKGP